MDWTTDIGEWTILTLEDAHRTGDYSLVLPHQASPNHACHADHADQPNSQDSAR